MGLRVNAVGTGLQGGPYLMVLRFTGTTQTNAQDAASAARTFIGACAGNMHSNLTWNVSPQVIAYSDTTGQPTASFSVTGLTSVTGTSSGEPMSTALNGLIRWRTGVYVGGREIRGRTFVPGLTENQNNNGEITSTAQGIYSTAAAGLIADANSNFAVWSKVQGTTAVVNGTSTWNFPGLQRRRRD